MMPLLLVLGGSVTVLLQVALFRAFPDAAAGTLLFFAAWNVAPLGLLVYLLHRCPTGHSRLLFGAASGATLLSFAWFLFDALVVPGAAVPAGVEGLFPMRLVAAFVAYWIIARVLEYFHLERRPHGRIDGDGAR